MRHVVVERELRIPVEQAFARLADPESLGELLPFRVEHVRSGDDGSPHGPGSIRRVSLRGLMPTEETILEVVPHGLIRYTISRGGPLRDYESIQRLTATPTGCSIRWEMRFHAVAPGLDRLLAPGVRLLAARALSRLDGRT